MKYACAVFLSFLISCSTGYPLLTGRRLNTQRFAVLAGRPAGQPFTALGVYGYKKIAANTYPVVRCYLENQGIGYTILRDTLDVEPFAIIRVKGMIVKERSLFGMKVLKVSEYEKIKNAQMLVIKVDHEYRRIKTELEPLTKPVNSRLEWPVHPQWQAAYEAGTQNLIVLTSLSDLLYAAEITFVMDQKGGILKVYSREEFKGE